MSFLHKRESISVEVDSRLRGNDIDNPAGAGAPQGNKIALL
jgi:hypothetical protein